MLVEAWFKSQWEKCFCFREGVWLLKWSPGRVQRVQVLSAVRPETQLCQDFLWGVSWKRVPGSAEGFINTKVGVLMQGWGSSLLVNGKCDMGYVHPLFPTSAAKLFWRTTETGHHPQGQPCHPSRKQNALMPSRVVNTGAEPCSLTSLLSGPMNTRLMLTVCLQDRL